MKLEGLTAVVTGSTSGIGKEVALLFAQEGAKTAVVGRNIESGTEVVEEIRIKGGTAEFFRADLTVESSVSEMIERVSELYGQIDILINNVGMVIPGTILDTSFQEWELIWKTNVNSTFLACREVIPYMLKQKSGSILNIASEAGIKGIKQRAAYSTAKFAVVGLTKALAVDHSKEGIRINCLCPGTIETENVAALIAKSSNPESTRQMMIERRLTTFLGTVEEVARAALFLSSPDNPYLTGAVLSIDGGASVK